MKIDLIDINSEFSGYQEITSPRIFYRYKFEEKGLFSEQIFGPCDDYKCQCGRYHGKEYANQVCPHCKVLVTSSNMRLTTMGKITIPSCTTIVNHIVLDLMLKLNIKFKSSAKIDKLIFGKERAIIKNNRIVKVDMDDDDGKQGPIFFKNEVYPLLLSLHPLLKEFDKVYGKYLFLNLIPVIPPSTRPISPTGDGRQYYIDEINEKYTNIIRTINNINDAPFEFEKIHVILQCQYKNLIDSLLSKFEHKDGFLRTHVLGKRVDYSGRAVIVVDGENLPLGWCKIPFNIAKEIYKPQIIKYLSERLKVSPLKIIHDYDFAFMNDDILLALKERFIGSYIYLNRQPSLHRPSFQSAKIYDIVMSDVIYIHPLITTAYNADKRH